MAKKAYIGVGNFIPRSLPAGYTQVEYIESTGAQYIDTGFYATSANIRVVCDWQYTKAPSDDSIFGSQTSGYSIVPYAYNSTILAYYVGKTAALNQSTIAANTRYLLDLTANAGTLTTTLNGSTATATYTQPFVSAYSIYVFANNNSGSAIQKTNAKLYGMQIYSNGTLVRDYVPCTNSAGAAGLYDMANGVFYQNAGTGTFAVGTSAQTSTARKIKKGYIGIDNVARKIKKAYIGIGGVARPCWSGGELAYYGTITPLSKARYDLAATSVGNYAIFAGGQGGTSVGNVVDAYNSSLVLSKSTTWNAGYRYWMAATSVGDYALFGGGRENSSVVAKTVQSYNKSLTYSVRQNLPTAIHSLAATTVGNYALFGGGNSSSYSAKNRVTSYNNSLTQSDATSLSSARYELAATTVGNYALFGGGKDSDSSSDVVDAYNASLTRTTPTALSAKRHKLAATPVGNYALFGGGRSGSSMTKIVDAYDASLTRSVITELDFFHSTLSATSVGEYALFAGWNYPAGDTTVTVSAYDTSLTKTTPTGLSTARYELAATTVGKYALFGGGYASSASAVVDAYLAE